MKLIVGLGNPGTQYRNTRHNAGFFLVDELAKKLGVSVEQSKFKGLIGEARLGQEKVLLLKPQTYMNLSGESIRAAMEWHKLGPEDILVAYDDMDIELGKIKFRPKGRPGGHNGIKSIIAHLGTDEFARLKIGIGRPQGVDVVSYVLTNFTQDERSEIDGAILKGIEGVDCFIETSNIQESMNKFNG
ncbi:aminoacyl-tRNA hydrolase [Desulfuribacillus stibiiarsenatis]|uniref:Peptidyl-tRNA hydrolase n=1 Tax=Desulfuribacillus stibiiarsenatis TaxID=1390249 RepID=A0A1E5L2I7_9FIRM|nr:aminoacyl-tRNA hydrolase [Desulfuribacillus stibiiarsenatis]OEH84340.1 aminoacyl-tRNA hydrolase [Desulfuribacillus stibiiarsenatis]